MLTYSKLAFLKVAEFHFDEDSSPDGADIVRHLWRSVAVPGRRCEECRTLLLDLTRSSEALLAKMAPETRYRIRRGAKDGLRYDVWSTGEPQIMTEFSRFYNDFAARKHLVRINRQRLSALAQLGVLDFSRVSDSAGRALVWHVHYRAADRVRGLYSASILERTMDSSLRGLIGRANRCHTWWDMLRFQQQGIATYDLGGWYPGGRDQEKLRINEFKESYGGSLVTEFNSECGITPAGRLALATKQILLWAYRCYLKRAAAGGEEGQPVAAPQ